MKHGFNGTTNAINPAIVQNDVEFFDLGVRKVAAVVRPEGYEGIGRTREEALMMLTRNVLTRLRVRQKQDRGGT